MELIGKVLLRHAMKALSAGDSAAAGRGTPAASARFTSALAHTSGDRASAHALASTSAFSNSSNPASAASICSTDIAWMGAKFGLRSCSPTAAARVAHLYAASPHSHAANPSAASSRHCIALSIRAVRSEAFAEPPPSAPAPSSKVRPCSARTAAISRLRLKRWWIIVRTLSPASLAAPPGLLSPAAALSASTRSTAASRATRSARGLASGEEAPPAPSPAAFLPACLDSRSSTCSCRTRRSMTGLRARNGARFRRRRATGLKSPLAAHSRARSTTSSRSTSTPSTKLEVE
mmetsp:Transcript_3406/g.12243  ORF Transcript_3406/g.12243 Transcript_3406/m.12243 type:complete len:291 (+) Transcript_3406:1689-2561(+)